MGSYFVRGELKEIASRGRVYCFGGEKWERSKTCKAPDREAKKKKERCMASSGG